MEVDTRTGGFRRGEDNPLDCDLLVIDEASMIDVLLMQALLKAAPDRAALLVVGDGLPKTPAALAAAPRLQAP